MSWADKLYFRQRLQGEGMALKESIHELESVIAWGGTVNDRMLKNVRFILRALPLSTFLFGVGFLRVVPLTVAPDSLPGFPFAGRPGSGYYTEYRICAEARLEPYLSMLRPIEKKSFPHPFLLSLKQAYTQQHRSSKQLESFPGSAGTFQTATTCFIFFIISSLWDYQCGIALKTKQECGRYLLNWFEGIATSKPCPVCRT